VCPDGLDCGIQTLREVLEVSPLSDQSEEEGGLHSSSTAAIVVVLVIALAALVLIVVYYRRRMKVLKTDLENRSVRYTQNPYHSANSSADIVIRDNHPLGGEYLRPPSSGQEVAHHAVHPSQDQTRLLYPGNEMLNNQLSLSSQGLLRSNNVQEERREKNTNIDNFKLGFSEPDQGGSCQGKQNNSCQGGLRVALEPEPGNSCRAAVAEDEAGAAICGAAAACQAMEDTDEDEMIGNGSGVLHSDINLLQREIQKEKAIKEKITLSFKNNISRAETGSKPEENEDPGPSCSSYKNKF